MQRPLMLFGLGALLIGLVGCSAPSGGGGAAGGTAQPAADQPKKGGVLNLTVKSEPFDWDPTIAGISLGNQESWQTAYESLVTVQLGPGIDFNDIRLAPGIAEKWEISPDAQTYTFHVRKGVKFANLPPVNGRELTAADVKFSYEYSSRTGQFKDTKLPPGKFVQFFEGMDRIDTPDPSTVVVHFAKPFAPFLSNAAEFTNPIMPHEIYDQNGNFSKRIVGTGAFQLDEKATQTGTVFTFKKNENYWDTGKPYLDEVRRLVLPDESTVTAAFTTKQLDIREFNAETPEQAKTRYPTATIYPFIAPGGTILYMNERRLPLSDIRVRKAIALGINHEEFAKTLNGGQAGYAMAGVFAGYFTEDEMKQYIKYDPEQAKKLLAEAGYGNGLDMEHFFPGPAFGDVYTNGVQLFQAQMKKIGINVTLKSFDLAEYLSRTRGNTYDLTLRPLSTGIDVDSFLFGSFHPTSGRNYNGVDDAKLTALIDAQRQEPDPAKRRTILKQASVYITENALGLMAYGAVQWQAWQSYVQNYRPNAARQLVPVTAAWLNK